MHTHGLCFGFVVVGCQLARSKGAEPVEELARSERVPSQQARGPESLGRLGTQSSSNGPAERASTRPTHKALPSENKRTVMRFVSLIGCLLLIACGCAVTPSRVVVDTDLVGRFEASFDFRAEARIHLKSDHTFEMYSVHWRNLRTNPASEVRESSGHDSGQWSLKGGTVVLISRNGVSTSLKIEVDRDALFLIRDKLRYRMLYPEEPLMTSGPTPVSVAPAVPPESRRP